MAAASKTAPSLGHETSSSAKAKCDNTLSAQALAALRPAAPAVSNNDTGTDTGTGTADKANIMAHIARLRALTAPPAITGPQARAQEAAVAVSSNYQKKNMKNKLGACKSLQKSSYTKRKDLAAHRREQNGGGGDGSVFNSMESNSGGGSADLASGGTSEYFDYVSEARAAANEPGADTEAGGDGDPHLQGGYSTNRGRAHNKFSKYKSKFGYGGNNHQDKNKSKPRSDNAGAMGGVFYGIDSLTFSLDHFTNTINPGTKSSSATVSASATSTTGALASKQPPPGAPSATYYGGKLESKSQSYTIGKGKGVNAAYESNLDDTLLVQCAPECMAHHIPSKLLVVKKSGPNKVTPTACIQVKAEFEFELISNQICCNNMFLSGFIFLGSEIL